MRLSHTSTLLSLSTLALAVAVLGADAAHADPGDGIIGTPEFVAQFTAGPPEFANPESLAIRKDDNAILVSMALSGEVRLIEEDGTQSALAVIPLGQCAPNPFPPIMGAIALDKHDNAYIGASACDPANRGIWKVTPGGVTTLLASLPAGVLPNGIAVVKDKVYLADSASDRVWVSDLDNNGGPASVWRTEPLLADTNPFDIIPGANGLQRYKNALYVANASTAGIVKIPLNGGAASLAWGPPGSGADVEVDYPGCDDFAFDKQGRLYCTTDPFQTVIRLNFDGTTTPILDASIVDGPTAAVFGRESDDDTTLYVSVGVRGLLHGRTVPACDLAAKLAIRLGLPHGHQEDPLCR